MLKLKYKIQRKGECNARHIFVSLKWFFNAAMRGFFQISNFPNRFHHLIESGSVKKIVHCFKAIWMGIFCGGGKHTQAPLHAVEFSQIHRSASSMHKRKKQRANVPETHKARMERQMEATTTQIRKDEVGKPGWNDTKG